MRRVIISTSSSGLDYLEKPDNVRMLPLHININGQDYLDGQDITYEEMTAKMVSDEDLLPTTSPVSVDELLILFNRLYSEGCKEVIILTVSAAMSVTYDNVMEAKSQFIQTMSIHVFDTRTLSYLEAVQVLEVSKMVDAGANMIQIKDRLDILRDNISFWVVVEDLRNIIKTKRLSAPKGFLANLFDIKPILGINKEGEVYPIDNIRGIDRALKAMCNSVAESLAEKPGQVFIITTGYDKHLQPLRDLLAAHDVHNVATVPAASVSIAVHGPYGIGIGVLHDC